MYSRFLFSFLFFFIVTNNFAQVSDGVWEGDAVPMDEYNFKAVKNIKNNGYIFVGTKKVTEPEVNTEIYVLRLDDNFEVLWSKLIGKQGDDYGNSLELTSDGGFIIAGTTEGTKFSEQKIFVLKLDSSGDIEWSKTIGDPGYPQEGNALKKTPDGGFIVVGTTETETNNKDMYVAKLDVEGKLEWDRMIGAEETEEAHAVTIAADGGFVVAGYTDSPRGRKNGYVVKLDPSGNLVWTSIVEAGGYSYVTDIITTEDGFFLTGGGGEGFVAKMNPTGDLQWLNRYTSTHHSSEFEQILMDESGYLFSFGRQASYFYIVKVKIDGTFQWARRYGRQDIYHGYGIDRTDDGGLVMTGIKRRRGNGNDREFPYIMKLPPQSYITCVEPIVDYKHRPGYDLSRLTLGEMVDGGGVSESVVFTVTEGPGIKDFCEALGVDAEEPGHNLKIYPNPADGVFHIESTSEISEITLYNSLGQKVYHSLVQTKNMSISTENFASGIYYISIGTQKGVVTKKIVINSNK